MNELIH